MADVYKVHPDNPQPRSISMAIDVLKQGGLIVYPTDSGYAMGWALDNHQAPQKVAMIKAVKQHQHYTMMCDNISQMTDYVLVDNVAFRLIKQHTPGPYTFILPATRRVPKKMQHQKRRTIGVRLSAHNVVQALLAELGEPMMTSSLEFPDVDMYELDIDDVVDKIGNQVDVIIDVGYCAQEPSTVVDLSDGDVNILRKGAGEIDFV
ncbi:L-threonylcarbamoyladenylate synthase [Marinicella gelatinilytica]|uniref:L-threonylcarbamoyladenylate synthase n=1 Tax=Marinicella gelatinilytica TaxID=2996017 RepID=UPI0022608402|nr:L-threonylcarbamoyladenylate synthase [Marinicella gelatinilytica]MCX7544554.1 L-threonylcarbamoyladenylate synthase [Marinicella gelatinilytica]